MRVWLSEREEAEAARDGRWIVVEAWSLAFLHGTALLIAIEAYMR